MSFHMILLDIIFIVIFPTLVSSVFLFVIHGFFIVTERVFFQRIIRRFCPNSNFPTRDEDELGGNGVESGLAIAAGCEGLTAEERRDIFALVLKEKSHSPPDRGPKGESSRRRSVSTTTESSCECSEEAGESKVEIALACPEETEGVSRKTTIESLDVSGIEAQCHPERDMEAVKYSESIQYEFTSFDMEEEEEETCAICLAEYEVGESVLCATHCSHHFHRECLLLWLEKKDVCPFCREPMITADEMKKAHQLNLGKSGSSSTKTGWRGMLSCRKTVRRIGSFRTRMISWDDTPSQSSSRESGVIVQESETADEVEIVLVRTAEI
jgi:hypothetical protein